MTTHTMPAMGTAATDGEFLGLVLADPQLLEAKFAEIITETRRCPPPPVGPRAAGSSDRPGRGPMPFTASTGGIQPVTQTRGPGAAAWNRQRSRPQLPVRPQNDQMIVVEGR